MIVVVVVPFLNEEQYLGRFLRSLAAQTRAPDLTVLVDDGSTDGSFAIAEAYARGTEGLVEAVRRPPRSSERDRLVKGQELLAFQWGLERVAIQWDLAGKLDADLELTPRTLETIEQAFASDPRLGIAGAYLSEHAADGRLVRLRSRPEHVNGATKFYRRRCYADVQPLPIVTGWEMVDTATARARGWQTRSLQMPEGDPLHLRAMGDYDGTLRGWRRMGMGAYALGQPPLYVALFSLARMAERPRVLGGLSFAIGWGLALLRRFPRAQSDVRAHVRREQHRRILRRRVRLNRRAPVDSR